MLRCDWCLGDALYEQYHDEEWGVPAREPGELFERLVLEGMQAGLSWLTVLKKRERMRQQFFSFDLGLLSRADDRDVARWLRDPGLIRHRGKLEAMVNNARLARERDDFAEWLWSFAPAARRRYTRAEQVPAHTVESAAMSRALKADGYRFVGPTTCYAFMQSVGMVNDHTAQCWRHSVCAALRGD